MVVHCPIFHALSQGWTVEYITVALSLYYNCDLTTIRLRHDYDEKWTCSLFVRVESRRMEAGARDTS